VITNRYLVLRVVKDFKNRGSITWQLSCGSCYGAAVGYSDHRYVALWFRWGISWLGWANIWFPRNTLFLERTYESQICACV